MAARVAFGWFTGGVARRRPETPGWLGLALVLAGSAIAFSALPLFAVRDPRANMNDTCVLEGLYESRVSLLRVAAAISATFFGFALLTGVIPPLNRVTRSPPALEYPMATSAIVSVGPAV